MRLVSFTLDNVKNVGHGKVDFPILSSGGSVTGIYGANGSGKTSVIDALVLLRQTMTGATLSASCGELVTIGEDTMSLTAVFLSDVRSWSLKYSVEYHKGGMGLGIGQESICLLGSPEQVGRPIVINDNTKGTELGLSPEYLWRSVAANHGGRNAVVFARNDAMLERRSYLFSDDFLALVTAAGTGGSELPVKAASRVHEVAALSEAVQRLKAYAEKDIAILPAKRTACVDYSVLPLGMPADDGGPSARSLDLLGGNIVSEEGMEWLDRNMRLFNQVLPVMVSGLAIRLRRTGTKLMGDGRTVVRFEPVSVRDGVEMPLRDESEGVIRIIGILAYLIRAFNDPDACVAVDGLDEGMFEYLFGGMLEEFTKGARGQLIFTAHNLRALERMQPTADTIVLSTLDPCNRFIPYQDTGKIDNPRTRYLNALLFGGTTAPLYEERTPQLIGAGLTLAGTEHTTIDKQVKDGMRSLMDVPIDGLDGVL